MSVLSISGIVQVNINVLPSAPVIDVGCNKGLIVGDSTVISVLDRVKSYRSLLEVSEAGFTDEMPEFLAAKIYFAQKPAPRVVYIGRHDSGATPAETIQAAVLDCLVKAPEVYGVYVCGASDADIDLVAKDIDLGGDKMLFFDTKNTDSLVASPAAPDVFTTLKTNSVERAIGIYSATDYAGAALLGAAMGRENGQENSAFSLSYATLYLVTPESVTAEQLAILMAKNGNVYAYRGQAYELLHMGRCISGTPYDDVMYLDMTKNVIEARVMEVMTGNQGKIPQTDAGMSIIVSAVSVALEFMRDIGYIAEGIWTGETINELSAGDAVAGGYMIFVDSFATLSQADRELRKAPPVYVALKTSGTIESVVINVNVNL